MGLWDSITTVRTKRVLAAARPYIGGVYNQSSETNQFSMSVHRVILSELLINQFKGEEIVHGLGKIHHI